MTVDGLLVVVLVVAGLSLTAAIFRMLLIHPVPVFGHGSVRAATARLLPAIGRRRRAARLLSDHQIAVALVIFGLVLAITFAPDWHVDIPPLNDEAAARAYLQTLWQVLAAAVGISIVMIAFVLEAFLSSGEKRHGGTLREFAADTWLLIAIDLGAATLITVGIVLQGNLRSAPAGWAGAMAILFSGIAVVVLLAVIPRRILRVIDPEQLRRLRSERTNEAVDDALREQIVGQVGDHLLLASEGTSRLTRGISALAGAWIASASRDGYLHDIRLGQLARVARKLPKGQSVDVLVAAGNEVQRGQPLACVPHGQSALARRRTRRAFVVRRRTSVRSIQALNRTLDRLAQQGLDAVRQRQEGEWREIGQLYRDVLVKFPSVASQLGVPFEGGVSRPGLLGYGPTSRLLDDLRDDLREVLVVDDPRIADALAHIFLFVAEDARGLKAKAIIRDTLGMYVAMYVLSREAVARTGETSTSRLLIERSHRLLFDGIAAVGGYDLADRARHEIDPADAVSNLRAAFGPTQAFLRTLVSRGDADILKTSLARLGEIAETWAPTGRAEAPTRDLLREIDGMILVVAMWAACLLAQSEDPENAPSALALSLLLANLRDAKRLLDAYEVVNADRGESFDDDWSWWFYDEERGGVQSLNGQPQIDQALILALTHVAGAQGRLQIEPRPILDYRADGLLQALDTVESDPRWRFLVAATESQDSADPVALPNGDPFAVGLGAVRAAMNGAIGARASAVAAEIRQAGLSADQVQQFVRSTIRTARAGRVIRDLMVHVGAASRIERPDSAPIGFRSWMNKPFFTGDASYVGQDMTARDLARRANMSERALLLDALPEGPLLPAPPIMRDAVEHAVRAMRQDGLSPSLILTPIGYELAQALAIHPFRGVALDASTVPAAHSGAFNGLIEDVPVLDDPRVATDRVLIIDLTRAVRLEEWPSESDSGIEVSIKAFTADEAATFVDHHPSVVPADSTPAETVDLLQAKVLIEVNLCWRMVSKDPNAVRLIEVPEPLRREAD
jgi:hypothetical protein